MNNMLRHLLLPLLLSASALPAGAEQVGVHDPVMAREGDRYYLFSTGPGITFYSSTDMRVWTAEGRIFAGDPDWAKSIAPEFDGHIWAPDIALHKGHYYLYYAVSAFGKNTSAIGVTINETLDPRAPNYRWKDHGVVLRSIPGRDLWNAIDPNVIEDAAGAGWLTFGSFWSGIKLARLNADWTGLAEPQEWHTLARRERPAFRPDAEAGPAEIEAPFLFRKGDYYYLFVSWGLCCRGPKSTYRVMVGRSSEIIGPYLDRSGMDLARGGGSLVIEGTPRWHALGHNGTYTFNGKDYLVLHAYETADQYRQKLKILQIHWDADRWPTVDAGELDTYQSVLRNQEK